MFLKYFIFPMLLIAIQLEKISSEALAPNEEEFYIDNELKFLIYRIQLIQQAKTKEFIQLHSNLQHFKDQLQVYGEKAKYTHELQLLKATLKLSLKNHTKYEKENLLKNFYKVLPDYFNTYLIDEFDKQYVDQTMLINSKYLQLMQEDLNEMGLLDEPENIRQHLKNVYALKSLEMKKLKYMEILNNLSLELSLILDSQPMHDIVLKAHLDFLNEFMDSVRDLEEEQEATEEYKSNFNILHTQLEIAQKSKNENEKFKFLNLFNDQSTKFGRVLNYKFQEFKFKYSENF